MRNIASYGMPETVSESFGGRVATMPLFFDCSAITCHCHVSSSAGCTSAARVGLQVLHPHTVFFLQCPAKFVMTHLPGVSGQTV